MSNITNKLDIMWFAAFLKKVFLLFLIASSFSLFAEEAPWVKVTDLDLLPCFGEFSKSEKEELILSLEESLAYLQRKSSKFHFPKSNISHARVLQSLVHFKSLLEMPLSAHELDQRIKQDFEIYKSIGRRDKKGVLFTGYYEPLYQGSYKETDEYRYPLYKIPDDLVLDKKNKVAGRRLDNGNISSPYWTRQDIDERGVLKGKGLELIYFNNPYDVYTAQFQGSVAVQLSSGKIARFGYKVRNCPSVGFSLAAELYKDKVFTKNQLLPSIIADFFYRNPDKLSYYLRNNPSYVFFVERKQGPMGALSVILHSKRAIATDLRLFPKAALAFVDLKLYKNKKNHPFQHFVLNQDTGGAVIGPGRCDIFFGTGDEAKALASDMFSVGQLYFFFIKE